MKARNKKICLALSTVAMTAGFAFGGVFAFSQAMPIQAVAMETEFSNNGQFTVGQYSGPIEYVTGIAGADGEVLKMSTSGGWAAAKFDFSASQIKASEVDSIVVRIYSPEYTSADEFRTVAMDNTTLRQYGVNAYDMSSWCNITLNADSIADMTDANGYLSALYIGARVKSGATVYYIDSITINMVEKAGVTFTGIHSWWNNYFHSEMYCSILEFSGGIAKGNLLSDYSDVYAKATLNGQPIDTSNFSLICRAWIDGQSDSIVMRWTTLPAAGSILHIPAGATFVNGSEDPNLYEIAEDVYMQFDGSKWAKCDKPAEAEKATFNSIWGNLDIYNASDRVLLQFNSTAEWNHTDKGDLATKVTYKNSATGATYTATDSNIAGWEKQRWIVFTGMTGYDVIEIAEGGNFGGVEIPALTIYNVNGRWVTMPASAVTTNYNNIAGGWNNMLSGGLGHTILSFDVNPLGEAADATNLAATTNRTSMMVKYNGKTFRELYAGNTQYQINYAHGKGYFYFAIPEADLVEGATFEIEAGTPFASQGLGEVKLILKNGVWEYYKEANYNPDFVSFGQLNHAYNEGLNSYGLSLKYDTSGFTSNGNQVMAQSATGFTLNDEEVGVALWGGDQLLFWLGKDKCEAGYNGFAHATLKIAEGAKIVNAEGKEYTFKALTLYLVDGQWTTEKPAEAEKATFNSIWGNVDAYNATDRVLLQFNSTTEWDHTNEGTLATKVTYKNSATGATYTATDSNIAGWEKQRWIVFTGMTDYDVIEIAEGGLFGGVEIPAVTIYKVNGRWVTTQASAVTTNFKNIAGGWNNAIGGGLSQTIVSFDVNPLGAAADATNLAASTNRTSLMIKYNGKTFRDLYSDGNNPNAKQYQINYAHGNNHLYFAIPEADMVEGATFEIEAGTPFAGQGLGALKLVFSGGAWTVYKEINYNPTFMSIGDINQVPNGEHYGISLRYNANGFTDENEQIMAAGYTGITINGDAQAAALWGDNQLLFWIHGSKLAEGYNGYSHATLKIAEGATVTNKYGETFTLGEATLYLVNGKWTTEQPADWTDKLPVPVNYTGIAWNNIDYGKPTKYTQQLGLSGGNLVLLSYSAVMYDDYGSAENLTNLIGADNDIGNKITVNGTPLKDVDGAYVCLISGRIYIYVPACNVLGIEAGTQFYNYKLSATTLYFDGDWSETEPTYKSVAFDRIHWNNYDYNNYGSIYGQENHVGTPSNGFCGLFAYSEDLGGASNVIQANDSNMATQYTDIGSKFKINGVPAKDIEGAYISYNAAQEYLYFYIPFSGLAQADVYTLTIEEGTKFIGASLPASTYYFYDGLFYETMPISVTIQYGETIVTQRFNGAQIIDAEYLANALAASDSIVPLSWTINGENYYAGDRVTVNETTTVVLTEMVNFETLRGASVRIMNDGNYGIRFESRIELASYLALVEKYGESNIKTGTYIAPKALFDGAGMSIADYFAQEQGTGEDSKYVHISNFDLDKNANGIFNKDTYETDGYIQYYGSLTNLSNSNYYTQFFGVGYISVTMGGKTVTVYGLNDVMKTNRTIYDVAVMAYSDLEETYTEDALKVLQHYIDSVAVLSYSNGNLFADTDVTGRNYDNAYTVTEIAGGYEITSSVQPKAIVINGKKVSVEVTGVEGAYAFTLATAYLDENFGSSIRYGLAEPCKETWGGGSDKSSAEFMAGVAERMGVSSYRVWPSGTLGGVAADNVVSLGTAEKTALKKQVKTLVDAGIDEIIFLSGQPIMPYTYESYYVQDANGNTMWVNREAYLNNHYTHIGHDTVAVPNPTEEPEAYATWLKVQYDFYVAFAAEVNAWKTEFHWTDNTVKFYFEGLNEPEFQNIIHQRGSYTDGEYTPVYFTTDTLAQILTDMAYYMTLALEGCGEVTTPALTNISSNSNVATSAGVYCDTLLSTMYAKINDSAAPTAISGITPANSNDENDYFTCLNWHPYLPWFKLENEAMYYGEIVTTTSWFGTKKESGKVNNSYADMWVDWNNGMYQIAVNGGDTDAPKVFFTEFGVCDWGNPTGSSDYRKMLGINENLTANVFKTLLAKANELVFVDELTVMAFRMFDIAELGAGEGNFGFINEEGQLKAIAKEYYVIINGDDDTSELQAFINEYFD